LKIPMKIINPERKVSFYERPAAGEGEEIRARNAQEKKGRGDRKIRKVIFMGEATARHRENLEVMEKVLGIGRRNKKKAREHSLNIVLGNMWRRGGKTRGTISLFLSDA